MRTTITIDGDLAPKIDAEMRRSGKTFKDTINHLLRLGLTDRPELDESLPFVVRAQPLTARPGLDVDSIGDLLEQLEGPVHR